MDDNSEDFLDSTALKALGKKIAENSAAEDVILAPLLHELNSIHDDTIKEFTRGVLLSAPSQFWTMPASLRDFFPPDERKPGGQILHTKRSIRIFHLICDARDRGEKEFDLGTSALLMHSILRGGTEDREVDDMQINLYDVIDIDQWLRQLREVHENSENKNENSSTAVIDEEYFEIVARMTRTYLGRYSPIPELLPIATLEWDVHLSYYIAASLHWVLDGEEEVPSRWKKRKKRIPEQEKNDSNKSD